MMFTERRAVFSDKQDVERRNWLVSWTMANINGGIAQLGEHLPCKQGVIGSNPIISTN